jgi:hypothetical protein
VTIGFSTIFFVGYWVTWVTFLKSVSFSPSDSRL